MYCKVWGRQISSGSAYNHWWLQTDPDVGPGDQYVSAYYLTAGATTSQRTTTAWSSRTAPRHPRPRRPSWQVLGRHVRQRPGYASPSSTTQTGTLYAGTNYVYCKVWGRQIGSGSAYNHWWLKTDLDVGPALQYVSAYYLSRWGNDVAKDNNGVVIADC